MRPYALLNLMALIDGSEDEAQIERWGKQSPLLRLYAHDRVMAMNLRRVGRIEEAMVREARNDTRYTATMRVRDHERGYSTN